MKKGVDKFAKRMKEYEQCYKTKLPKRSPILLRLDGKAFHTYTKGMGKPFDSTLNEAFQETAKFLCENIMGAKVAYHQSDEISILITNYHKLTTESWFDNNLQKIVSVASSLATAKFNEIMRKKYPEKELAFFDCRAWSLPKDEVNNYFFWRQLDASKNSVSMVAQSQFSQSELYKKSSSEMKTMLLEKGIKWEELPMWQQRGSCIKKEKYKKEDGENTVFRRQWIVDECIPMFSKDPGYINRFVYEQSPK